MSPLNMNSDGYGRGKSVSKRCNDLGCSLSPTEIRRKCSDEKQGTKSRAKDDSCVYALTSKVDLSQLPPEMVALLSGAERPLPNELNLPPIPAWLDTARLKKGQAFVQKYFFGVVYSQILSTITLLTGGDAIKPLIYTEKSHTPSLAQTRYLASILDIKSWYDTEIWKPTSAGYKSLKKVRAIHFSVSNRLNSISVDEVHRLSNLEEKLKSSNSDLMCPLAGIRKQDFDESRIGPLYPVYEKKQNRIYLNQIGMALTQLNLFAFVLLHPDKFGAEKATGQELADFVHLWRYIGYMLGIEDEYNVCEGDLETVKHRSRQIMEYFVKPMLLKANEEWEHMSRSAILGIVQMTKLPITFESTMLYFYWILEIDTPHLMKYVSWKELILFRIVKYLMTSQYKVPGTTQFLNFVARAIIEWAGKKERAKGNIN